MNKKIFLIVLASCGTITNKNETLKVEIVEIYVNKCFLTQTFKY